MIYGQKDEIDMAIDFLERSLNYYEEIGDIIEASGLLFQLIPLTLETGQKEQAQGYLDRLKQFDRQETNKTINQRSKLAEAIILKTSSRQRKKFIPLQL